MGLWENVEGTFLQPEFLLMELMFDVFGVRFARTARRSPRSAAPYAVQLLSSSARLGVALVWMTEMRNTEQRGTEASSVALTRTW